MRRYTYAPKVYAYVRSSNMNGKVYDLSDDIVSGEVVRNINQLSTASIVLRNRYKKWLADPATGKSILLPMDMITIWMQRVAGKPIQVFTGYLDSVPYDQLYPGNCELRASCTLKKLGIERFDPGLEFFTNWVDHLEGWFINPATGEAFNNVNLYTASNPGANPQKKSKINDGGFAELIYGFMTQIARWNDKNVIVDQLPPNIPERAASLYKDINKQTEADLKTLEDIMGRIMGINWTPTNGIKLDGTLASGNENAINLIRKKADQYNIPLNVLILAGLVLTGFTPSYSNEPSAGTDWGFGLFAARPSVSNVSGPQTIQPVSSDSYRGFSKSELTNPTNAADAFCRDLIESDLGTGSVRHTSYSTKAKKGDGTAIQAWIQAAAHRKIDPQIFIQNISIAEKWTKIWNKEHNQKNTVNISAPTSIIHFDWNSPEVVALLKSDSEKSAYQKYYKNKAIPELAPIFWWIKKNYPAARLTGSNQNKNILDISVSDGDTGKQIVANLNKKNRGNFDQVTFVGSPISQLFVFSHSGANYPNWDGQHPVAIANTDNNNPDPTAKATNVKNDGFNFQQLATFSLDSAFTAQFAFPTDIITSHSLTGDKSLMNDVPCLDAVEQFCQASLRNFMSLPDGRFCAFHPDYFGAHGRGPYWWIHDIEITNMGIQLNDDSLATHVYVVGDTFGMDGTIDIWDQIASRGVVTIAQAFMLDSFIVPERDFNRRKSTNEPSFGRLHDAYDFLQHFGARVYKEEQPLIRNSFYEFLYAWQRFMQKWSEQFATQVTFTFQPEVFAGGIIGFPQHNLQMYVQQVTHTFDYASGFETTAVLTSPAAINKKGGGVGDLPGFALAGNVNSVGASD